MIQGLSIIIIIKVWEFEKVFLPRRQVAKGNPDKEDIHSPRVPDLDGPVARRGHNVLLVEVDDVDGGTVANEHAPQVDLGGRHLQGNV